MYGAIDIHKNFSQAIVCGDDGTIIKERKISTDREAIRKFFSMKKMKIAIEATTLSYSVIDILEEMGHEVIVSHPKKTRAIADAKIKTDKIDAETLVHLLRADLLPQSYVPPKDIRDLRELVSYRRFLGVQRTAIKNRIHATLTKKGIQYTGDIFTLEKKDWLRSFGDRDINSLLCILDTLDEQIKSIEREMRLVKKKYEEVEILTSIPGIATYSALAILSCIGDINRFPDEEKLFAYAGLIPSTKQSGNNCYHGNITKEGNKLLRWILTEVTRVHVIWCKESKITKFYNRLREKKPENVALIATAKKMLGIIFHMLKQGEKFEING